MNLPIFTAQANGAYWFPVREDLDSMLSKIDPGMIQDVIVIPGPYGLRYGPGIDFIDIITADTPRYDDGYRQRLPRQRQHSHERRPTLRTPDGRRRRRRLRLSHQLWPPQRQRLRRRQLACKSHPATTTATSGRNSVST